MRSNDCFTIELDIDSIVTYFLYIHILFLHVLVQVRLIIQHWTPNQRSPPHGFSSVVPNVSEPPPHSGSLQLRQPPDLVLRQQSRPPDVHIANPRYQQFQSLDARIRSFSRWPPHLVQTPQLLAETGLFYTGKWHKMTLFLGSEA